MVSHALLVAAVALGALVALTVSRRWSTWKMQRRFAVGRRGEKAARTLLESKGYVILDEQVGRRGVMSIDGNPTEYDVRADFLARRRGRTYVVEVKTGAKAPDPTGSATRRQLLEYSVLYDAQALLLADMSAGVLREIRFPGPTRRTGGSRRLVAAILVGLAVGGATTHLVDTVLLATP